VVDLKHGASSKSQRVHDDLTHPVIDADGHWLEPIPILLDYLRDAGGTAIVDTFRKDQETRYTPWYSMTPEERSASRTLRVPWWNFTTDALAHATVSIPALLNDRLDEFGIDFAIVYPSLGLGGPNMQGDDMRRAFCRAINQMSAEMFAPYSSRMTPVATLPSSTPSEAIEELDYVVSELHMKAAMMHGSIPRPIPSSANTDEVSFGAPIFVDTLALDAVYDYDPLWQKFVDLDVAVTAHGGSMGWMDRRSPTNYCFNHIGHFAQANHTFAKALFFAGVPYRFPGLNFCFLEGGVGWACNLLSDLIGHWRVRSRGPILENLHPANLDTQKLRELYETHGGSQLAGHVDELLRNLDLIHMNKDADALLRQEAGPSGMSFFDDFEEAHVSSEVDIRERFTKNWYFGCEADDPMTAWAVDTRFDCRLKAVLGSDIGHFDVPDMTQVLAEAYELVERGLLTEEDFKDFSFGNAIRLHAGMNPNFFEGTVVESAVEAERGLRS